ncbi:MAG: deaminase, partial [Candidatus Izemoplasmatales bacterium]
MSNKTIEKRMKKVIDYVMTNALEYETFTGAMLMKDDEIIYKEMTSISKDHNPLAHAELKVIQRAIEKYGNDLSSFQLYTTQKP